MPAKYVANFSLEHIEQISRRDRNILNLPSWSAYIH